MAHPCQLPQKSHRPPCPQEMACPYKLPPKTRRPPFMQKNGRPHKPSTPSADLPHSHMTVHSSTSRPSTRANNRTLQSTFLPAPRASLHKRPFAEPACTSRSVTPRAPRLSTLPPSASPPSARSWQSCVLCTRPCPVNPRWRKVVVCPLRW